MNSYVEMKERHQKEVNNFPIKFAFSDEQFKRAMEELGLTENDLDKVVSIGAGGFIRKTDIKAYNEMGERQYKEVLFLYELGNHEYIITFDISESLDAVGLTEVDIRYNNNLRTGLILAEKEYLEQYEEETQEEEEI